MLYHVVHVGIGLAAESYAVDTQSGW